MEAARQPGPRGRSVSAGKLAAPPPAWRWPVPAPLPGLSLPRPAGRSLCSPQVAGGGRQEDPPARNRAPNAMSACGDGDGGPACPTPGGRRRAPGEGPWAWRPACAAPGTERAPRAGPLAAFPAGCADSAPGRSAWPGSRGGRRERGARGSPPPASPRRPARDPFSRRISWGRGARSACALARSSGPHIRQRR